MRTTNTVGIMQRATNTLEHIRNLPVLQLDLRQPALVTFAAETVQYFKETYGFDGEVSPHYECWWSFYRTAMVKAGFEYLGSGYFSAVFSHPLVPERAFKVGFKKEDSGAAYAAFCRANQHRPGIPKVHAVERHQACYTVVLDLLTEFSTTEVSKEVWGQYSMVRDIIECGNGAKWESHRSAAGTTLWDTALAIHEFFDGIASFDLHAGNVMLDKRGELVITDPVSYSHGELTTVDFGGLVHEVQALKDKQTAQRALKRWKRHHMSTKANALRKVVLKRKRKIRRGAQSNGTSGSRGMLASRLKVSLEGSKKKKKRGASVASLKASLKGFERAH